MRIVSLGEILWDVIEGVEHLGGAPLNFSAHAGRLGHEVRLVSAVGDDALGRRALEEFRRLGLSTELVSTIRAHPTGTVTVSMAAGGKHSFVIHRPAAYDFPELGGADIEDLEAWSPEWIYFGTLAQTSAHSKSMLDKIAARVPGAKRFYDVNLRVGCYTPELVAELLGRATLVKLNDEEMQSISAMTGIGQETVSSFCKALCERFGCSTVCVTLGANGCGLFTARVYIERPGYKVQVADTVGAGDAFSAALVHGLGSGWPPGQVAEFCNRVGGIVASRRGAIPHWTQGELGALA